VRTESGEKRFWKSVSKPDDAREGGVTECFGRPMAKVDVFDRKVVFGRLSSET
jgi:hypothetical protein